MALNRRRIFYITGAAPNRVETLLELTGATFVCFTWGRGDLLKCMAVFGAIDIILIDLTLLETLPGYDVYSIIRSDVHFANTPIISISALDAAVEISRISAKRFAGFVSQMLYAKTDPHALTVAVEESGIRS